MKQKLKDLGLGASLLPFVILLCAIEMGGCEETSTSTSTSPCYDDWVQAVADKSNNAFALKNEALVAAANAKDTTKDCEERKDAAKLAKEKATAAKTAAEAARTNAASTPSKDK